MWPLEVQFMVPAEHRNGELVHNVKDIILKSCRSFGGPSYQLGLEGNKIISTSENK